MAISVGRCGCVSLTFLMWTLALPPSMTRTLESSTESFVTQALSEPSTQFTHPSILSDEESVTATLYRQALQRRFRRAVKMDQEEQHQSSSSKRLEQFFLPRSVRPLVDDEIRAWAKIKSLSRLESDFLGQHIGRLPSSRPASKDVRGRLHADYHVLMYFDDVTNRIVLTPEFLALRSLDAQRHLLHHEIAHVSGTPKVGRVMHDAILAEPYAMLRTLELGGVRMLEEVYTDLGWASCLPDILEFATFFDRYPDPLQREQSVLEWIKDRHNRAVKWTALSDSVAEEISTFVNDRFGFYLAVTAAQTARGHWDAARYYLNLRGSEIGPQESQRLVYEALATIGWPERPVDLFREMTSRGA